ncbi:MAG: suppressor of fused domain protein [Planctomycetes bacterium]|nr:suppressor of fused domain protein [Planctomycetota bacterium]
MSAEPEGAEEEPEVSPGGSRIYRHQRRVPFAPTAGSADNVEAITAHIEATVGPIAHVLHEVVSDLVHVDLHVVEPSEARPYLLLVTSGMSEVPMRVPPEVDPSGLGYAELAIQLPSDWPMEASLWRDEANFWPLRWLKILARLPHAYDTWLGVGHTIPNGDPPRPFAPTTAQCGVILVRAGLIAEDFVELEHEGKRIEFFQLVPLHADEMDFKLEHGADALFARFAERELSLIVDPQRPSVLAD